MLIGWGAYSTTTTTVTLLHKHIFPPCHPSSPLLYVYVGWNKREQKDKQTNRLLQAKIGSTQKPAARVWLNWRKTKRGEKPRRLRRRLQARSGFCCCHGNSLARVGEGHGEGDGDGMLQDAGSGDEGAQSERWRGLYVHGKICITSILHPSWRQVRISAAVCNKPVEK